MSVVEQHRDPPQSDTRESIRIYTDEEIAAWEADDKALESHREWLEAMTKDMPIGWPKKRQPVTEL